MALLLIRGVLIHQVVALIHQEVGIALVMVVIIMGIEIMDIIEVDTMAIIIEVVGRIMIMGMEDPVKKLGSLY